MHREQRGCDMTATERERAREGTADAARSPCGEQSSLVAHGKNFQTHAGERVNGPTDVVGDLAAAQRSRTQS